MINFANSLDTVQARQNVQPDLDPNCLTLCEFANNNNKFSSGMAILITVGATLPLCINYFSYLQISWPPGFNSVFMLNLTEHESHPAHKC